MTTLSDLKETEFSLEELVQAVRELLQEGAPPPKDGRVAEYPDARTIRYYQSIGTLDKPLRYDGRVAVYGYQHLVQVLAIKVLQSQGYSLAQIQKALLSTTPARLQAQIEATFHEAGSALEERGGMDSHPAPAMTSRRRRARPMIASTAVDTAAPEEGRGLVAVEVAPGVTVLLDPHLVGDPHKTIASIRNSLEEEEER